MAEEAIMQVNTEASREMIDAGVFYGRKKSKTNPKMRQFVMGNRGGIEVINLEKTEEALGKALGFVTEKIRNGGIILIRRDRTGCGNLHPRDGEKVRHAVRFEPLGRRHDHELQDHPRPASST
jgi:ribosomal protein S2